VVRFAIASHPTIARCRYFEEYSYVNEAIAREKKSMQKEYAVYIMTNERNTVVYTGVTNNIARRVYEHKAKITKGFTKQYNISKLVYVEYFQDIDRAIAREKNIKAGSRKKKEDLITDFNPEWKDLSGI